jgi:hypothetical protein
MTRKRAVTIVGLSVLGVVVIAATATAYRAAIEHWEGDPRGTLIAAAIVGISFFVSMVSMLSWTETRRRRTTSAENGAVTAGEGDRVS